MAECLDEIKSELRQENIAIKAIAVNKLTYVSDIMILVTVGCLLMKGNDAVLKCLLILTKFLKFKLVDLF